MSWIHMKLHRNLLLMYILPDFDRFYTKLEHPTPATSRECNFSFHLVVLLTA